MAAVQPVPPRRGRAAIPLLALLAAACAQAQENKQTPENKQAPETASAARPLSEGWLVGSWVPEGENCASDAGIIYNADRTWNAEGTIGTWTIEGETVVTVVTAYDDGETSTRPVAPERSVQQIEPLGPDSFVSRMEDGTVLRWGRCPGP